MACFDPRLVDLPPSGPQGCEGRKGRRVRRACLALFCCLEPVVAHADFYDKPFELRLFFAVDRQSNYSTTLARQASIAALEGASANPGAAAWREPAGTETTLTASFVDGIASGGRQFVAAPVSFRWQSNAHGTIAFAYAHTDTLQAEGDADLTRSLRSDEWIGGYGRHIDARSAAGFTARITSGKIVDDQRVGGVDATLRNDTRFLSREVHVGYARELDDGWSIGVTAGYGLATAETAVTNRAPLVVPVPGLPGGVALPPDTLLATADDTIRTFAIGTGAGYVLGAARIYADARGLRLATHRSGSQNLGRFALGADYAFHEGWIALAGVSVDTVGKANVSAGVAYRPSPSLEAQFTVQSNAAPELNPELGRTRLVAASLACRF